MKRTLGGTLAVGVVWVAAEYLDLKTAIVITAGIAVFGILAAEQRLDNLTRAYESLLRRLGL